MQAFRLSHPHRRLVAGAAIEGKIRQTVRNQNVPKFLRVIGIQMAGASAYPPNFGVPPEVKSPGLRLGSRQPRVFRDERKELGFLQFHRCESVPPVYPALITAHQIYLDVVIRFLSARCHRPERRWGIEAEVDVGIGLGGGEQIGVGGVAAPLLFRVTDDELSELEPCTSKTNCGEFLRKESVAEICQQFIVKEREAKPAFRFCTDEQVASASLTFPNQR